MWNIEKRYLECTCDRNNRQILLFTTNAEQIMALTYKKAGVDISKIKQSQKAIGKLITSTHKLQKKANRIQVKSIRYIQDLSKRKTETCE